jgi:hypothetical protein
LRFSHMAQLPEIIWGRPRRLKSMLSFWTLPPPPSWIPDGPLLGTESEGSCGLLASHPSWWTNISCCFTPSFLAGAGWPLWGQWLMGLVPTVGAVRMCPTYVKLLAVVPGFPSDLDLLMLAFLLCPAPVKILSLAHLGFLVAELWKSSALP